MNIVKALLRGLGFIVLAIVVFGLQAVVLQEFFGWGWQLIAILIANEFAFFLIVGLLYDNRVSIANLLKTKIFTKNGKMAFVLAFIILMIAGITESFIYTWQEWILVLVILFAVMIVVVRIVPMIVSLFTGAKVKSFIRGIILLIAIVIGGGLAVSIIAYLYVWFAQGVVNQYVQYVKPAVFKPYLIAGATIVLLIVSSYCWSKGKQKGLAVLAIAAGTAILMQPYTIAHAQSVLGAKLVLIPAGLIVPFGIGAFVLAGFFLLWDKVK